MSYDEAGLIIGTPEHEARQKAMMYDDGRVKGFMDALSLHVGIEIDNKARKEGSDMGGICSLCLKSHTYSSGCPFEENEAEAVMTCSDCKGDICDGDRYVDSDEGPVCENCLEEMTSVEALEFVGYKFNFA
jgi:hypothetical protein